MPPSRATALGEELRRKYAGDEQRQEWRRGTVASFDLRREPELCQMFLAEVFKFPMRPSGKDYGLSDAQLCIYGEDDYFDRHLDLDEEDAVREGGKRLTMILSLSSNYHGGDLVTDAGTIKLEAGEAVLFDAGTLYHGVQPVASGQRMTLVFGIFWRPWTFLLDRDGVINRDVGRPGVLRLADFEIFPGVSTAVERIRRSNFAAVVTNQKAVARQLLSPRDLAEIHAEMAREVQFDLILSATDDPYLKPSPFLLEEALNRLLRPQNETLTFPGTSSILQQKPGRLRDRSLLIGDSPTDMMAAQNAGVDCAILVTSSHHGRACADTLVPARQLCERRGPSVRPSADLAAALAARHGGPYRLPNAAETPVAAIFPDFVAAVDACLDILEVSQFPP